jgi:hypothetical protein
MFPRNLLVAVSARSQHKKMAAVSALGMTVMRDAAANG